MIQRHPIQARGYLPLIDFQTWRVAVLTDCQDLEVENLKTMQRHDQTDEVFVLLEGRCILFETEGPGQAVRALNMEPFVAYNVKRGTYHTHTLTPGSRVLIVENQDTGDHNSPLFTMTDDQRAEIAGLTAELWG